MDLITAISYVFKDAAAIISILMIMHYVFLDSLRNKKIYIITVVLSVFLNAFIGVFILMKIDATSDELMDFVSNVIFILAARTLTNQKKTVRIIWIVMLYLMTAEMLYSLFSSFLPKELYSECLVHGIMFSAVGILIYVFSTKSSYNILPQVFDEIPRWVFVAVMFFDLACYYKEFGISEEWYNMMYIFSSAMLILCVLYLFYRVFRLSFEQSNALKQIQLQSEYYSKKLEDETALRSFRHDYKNHMMVVDSYLKSGKLGEASEYLKAVNSEIKDALHPIHTGNFVADAVINSKRQKATEKGIELFYSGIVPEDGIEPQDVCLIFSNLIDNAIEATEKLDEKRQITVRSGIHSGVFILSVTNPCKGVSEREKGLFRTTKSDSKNHGIGLKNVRTAAEKYGGEFTVGVENGIFSADIRLNINLHTKVTK